MAKTPIHTPLHQKNFVRFSEQIDAIKEPISAALGGVLSYEEHGDSYISAKIFNDQLKNISQHEIDNAHIFLYHYSNKLKRLKEELMNDTVLNESQKKILLNIIQWNILRSLLLHYAVYIEAEKWGYRLNPEKKQDCLQKIEKIETIIYGPKISTQTEEKKIIMSDLERLFSQNSHKLTKDDQHTFENFLKKFPERNPPKKSKEQERDLWELSLMDICYLFQKVANIYAIPNKIVIIDDTIDKEKEENNILYIPRAYDQQKTKQIYNNHHIDTTVKIIVSPRVAGFGVQRYVIDIPTSRTHISIKRLCELIDHEISTHLIRTINQKNTINIKTEGYLETEEWIATMNEKLATQKKDELEMDVPTLHNISTFIGENYDFDMTKKLMKIYYRLQDISETESESLSKKRALRVKRFHAFDQPWASRKDVVYRRWLVDAISYIKDLDKDKQEDLQTLEKDIFTFYMSKLGKEEIKNADQLFEGFAIDKGDVIMPIALGKLIYEKLLGNPIDPIGDIRFLSSQQQLDYPQKKLLLEIISFIKDRSTPQ